MSQSTKVSISPSSIAFITLGCAKNEVDTLNMKKQLRLAGFSSTENPEEAQAIIVNTCSFIQSATEESLAAIFEAAELPNIATGAPLIVAGCMPARYGEDLSDELLEAQAFVPCNKEEDIVEVVKQALGITAELISTKQQQEIVAAAPEFISASAYVKISDGCDRFCTYCTIPSIRGRYHSFPYEVIYSQVVERIQEGAREIVLIAQDTGNWGVDFESPLSLAWLIEQLAASFPSQWFRVMYIQPEGLSDELLLTIEKFPNVCNYLDIPLQHVDKDILAAMNRSGSQEEFFNLVARIRKAISSVTLRTTFIAGFPGETEEQFEALLDFIDEDLFDYVGVFSYSREEGTAAYNFDSQVDEDEKNYRTQQVRDRADALCHQRVAKRVGSTFEVLVEGIEEDGQLFGRAMCQAPEVDGVVYLEEGIVGEIKTITITDTLLYEMEGN